MEISQANIAQAPVEDKTKLADDICRLIQVRDYNKDMIKDWLLFVTTSNFKVTAGEIYLAFKMALSREIKDSKGEEIELLPILSNNTTGKVIAAYLRYKAENDEYNRAKLDLKKLKSQPKEATDEEKQKIKDTFLAVCYEEIKAHEFYDAAHLLYDDLVKLGKIIVSDLDKKIMYKQELEKYASTEKSVIKAKNGGTSILKQLEAFEKKINGGKPVAYVKNRCMSILVCKYLKAHTESLEVFKKAIQE